MTLAVVVVPGLVSVGQLVHDQIAEGVVTPPSIRPILLVTKEAGSPVTVRVNLTSDLKVRQSEK